MAIVTFGATARSANSISITNTTANNLVMGLLRSTVIGPSATKSMTFADFDAHLRGNNINHNMLYSVNSDGKKPYQDDVSEFAALAVAGTIKVYTASQNASTGVFTTGAALASSVYADGSVIYS